MYPRRPVCFGFRFRHLFPGRRARLAVICMAVGAAACSRGAPSANSAPNFVGTALSRPNSQRAIWQTPVIASSTDDNRTYPPPDAQGIIDTKIRRFSLFADADAFLAPSSEDSSFKVGPRGWLPPADASDVCLDRASVTGVTGHSDENGLVISGGLFSEGAGFHSFYAAGTRCQGGDTWFLRWSADGGFIYTGVKHSRNVAFSSAGFTSVTGSLTEGGVQAENRDASTGAVAPLSEENSDMLNRILASAMAARHLAAAEPSLMSPGDQVRYADVNCGADMSIPFLAIACQALKSGNAPAPVADCDSLLPPGWQCRLERASQLCVGPTITIAAPNTHLCDMRDADSAPSLTLSH